uniref:Uncharacterized protein n=1 Tax=Oryza rufipogon TaxID=4529 RepID=A0A0E0NGN2_ORYRU
MPSEKEKYCNKGSTEKKLHTTKQMLDLFARSLELHRNEGHLLQQNQQKYNMLVNEINMICAQSAFLRISAPLSPLRPPPPPSHTVSPLHSLPGNCESIPAGGDLVGD